MLEDLEAGGEEQHVDLVRGRRRSVTTAAGSIRSIGVVSSCDVGAVERREVLVVEARPLAPERVARRQLVAHDRVADLAAQVARAPARSTSLATGSERW